MLDELAAIIMTFGMLIFIAAIWELVWKGIALWYAARESHKVWYVCILIFNTLGILPIIYLLIHKNNRVNKAYRDLVKPKKKR